MPARRRTADRKGSPELDSVSARLEFLAALMLLPPEAKEQDKVAIAERVGFDAATVARIFGKTGAAAAMALSRARQARPKA